MTTDKDALLDEVIERMEKCIDVEGENRKLALEDLRFLSGDQWPEMVKRQRTVENRPCLTINKLPVFIRQVTNDQLQNSPAIKVHPVDDGADVETAEVIQGLIRHIEYASDADTCYDTAVTSSARIGIGYFRLVTDYCAPDTFDQEIKFKRIRNPFTVYFDPSSVELDGSDARFAILSEEIPKDEFKRQYPKAEAASIDTAGIGDSRKHWISKDSVRVAEYYRIEETPAKLVMLSNGESGYKDDLIELPDGVEIVKERDTVRRQVRWYKVTATDVLEEADIPCDWIPVFPVYGEELDIDGKVTRRGMIRDAKDPAQMYNFWMTSATEEIALRPKVPYIGAEGQFEGHETQWRQANVRSFPYLEYKPKTAGGQLAPPPSRQPMSDVPVGVLQMAMHANDNIKATTGIFDASLGARGNETSGKAIIARQREGDTSNFHFVDNLQKAIRHAGRCILSMIPKIYDTERVVRILGEDETVSHTTINKQLEQPEPTKDGKAIRTVLNDLTVGKYDVTISTGPSYSTKRQEAADAMIQFGQSWPKLMDIAGDKVVKAMDWPGADDIAERIAKTLPPGLKDKEDGEESDAIDTPMGPVPKDQIGNVVAQMHEAIQQMQQALQEAQTGIEKERLKAESAEKIAQINAEAKLDAEELKGWIQLMVQQMQPPPQLTAAVAEDMGETEQTQNPPSAGFSLPEGGEGMQQ